MADDKRDRMPHTHPRHPDGPCKAYDPKSLPGKGPDEIRAELIKVGLLQDPVSVQ
jgi:hypothetical protein